jgi:pyridinium-3,5-bisthiocarboxylic acid mononucleotide nickel chelatase
LIIRTRPSLYIYTGGTIIITRRVTSVKIAYFDCFSGISGDMCLGALIDAGVPLQKVVRELKKIPVTGYRLASRKVKRSSLSAIKLDVIEQQKGRNPQTPAQSLDDLKKIIGKSSLPPEIKQKGLRIFTKLFQVEAKVHGIPVRQVHLHELSAVDSIVDIFGTLIGLDLLGIEKVFSSPINLGSGFVETQHGTLPVPAPAVVEILRDVPVYSKGMHYELTTPTGALLMKELASEFRDIPLMENTESGIGAGSRNESRWPNVLRVFIGNLLATDPSGDNPGASFDEVVTVIETNIDDMNPQLFEYVMEKLFRAGALDVFLTQILMKKGRPGIKLSVLCRKKQRNPLITIIMKETSTIGVRFHEVKRIALERTIKKVDTEFGRMRVKFSRLGDEIVRTTPEYEDCKKIARKRGIPLIQIMKKVP